MRRARDTRPHPFRACVTPTLAWLLIATAASGQEAGHEPPSPLLVEEQVTVTATRTEQRLGESGASVVVLSAEDLETTAAGALDDALRQVPGFTLFRRTGSRFANPTTQGASLRGVGGSGAGRALVVADGIPLTDPFGGWVAWGRVPRIAVERAEVLRGAGSDLWGSGALAGTIQLVTRGAGRRLLLAEASAGELGSAEGSLFAAGGSTGWGGRLAAEAARVDGYVLPAPAERGPVDEPAGSRHESAEVSVERRSAGGDRLWLGGSVFDERRENGTPLQDNDTAAVRVSAGGDWRLGSGALGLRAWAGEQTYRQAFTAVAPDRASERLTRLQEVPAEEAGASLQWSRAVGSRHALVAGLEARTVEGTSEELAPAADGGGGALALAAGGRQRSAGLFLADVVSLGDRLSLSLGARFDGWENAGRRTGAGVVELPQREESAVSPRLALRFAATERLALTAAAYRAFRAPTLNELYRAFRVGDVVTLANEELRAERLSGGEVGALAASRGGRLAARATLFWMEVERPIVNLTVADTPELVTRRRENLGRTRSRGLEAEATARAGRFALTAGWLLADAVVLSHPADRALEGLRLPQVPRHQLTLQARWAGARGATAALQARWGDESFEDDRNRLRLASCATVDAHAARPLGRGLSAVVAAENLLDERCEAGRTPALTLGPPRLVRLGLRLELPSRQ